MTPVPDSATVSGLPGALLARDSVPVSGAAAGRGELDADRAGAARGDELPQVLVWLNGPLTLTEETEAALVPGLVTVTVCAALVDPDATSPNDRLDVESVSEPGCTGFGKAVSTGVVLQPELPLPRLKV